MINFKIAEHKLHAHEQVVEIWSNDKFIASLYGLQGECGLKLVSKHLPTTDMILSHPTPFVVLNPTEPASLEIRFQSEEPRP